MTSADGASPAADSLAGQLVPALMTGRGFLRAPVDPATARGFSQLTLGFAWAVTAGLVLVVSVVGSVATVPALGLGLPSLAVSLYAAHLYAEVERRRIAAQVGVVVPASRPRRPAGRGPWALLWAPIRDGRAWAAVGYAAVTSVCSGVLFAVVAGLAAASVAAIVFVLAGGGSRVAESFGVSWGAAVFGVLGAAVVLVWLAAVAAQYGAYLTVRLAATLLAPSPADVARERAAAAERRARDAVADASAARERAEVLTESRSAAVAAADGERRRIERDLHDGAQQRLVALGVELGVARRVARKDPAAAVPALDLAHSEVKETLSELRDLVRGIHPAVLSDRGLDAALSALAARSPIPVEVEVDGDLAPADQAAQAAAYFVVAESLTNVAKHAGARSARVRASLTGEPDGPGGVRLRVTVSDDGRGGAVPSAGSGLEGLRGRIAALDGTFELDSPPGEGTRLTVEVPGS